jgi:hypothetical protein
MRPTLRGKAVRMQRCEMRAAATTWLRRVRAFRALGMGVARLAGCDSLARKRPAKRTKARIPPECSSSSIATGRRERPPRQAAHSPRPLHNIQTLVRLVQTFVQTFVTYKRWYRDRFQLPRSMAPALTNARDRTAPVVGKGRASNRAGAALPAPTSRVATGTGMVLHMDALGGVPKGVTTKMVIERADGLNVYVPCVTDSTCKSCTPTCRTTGSSW